MKVYGAYDEYIIVDQNTEIKIVYSGYSNKVLALNTIAFLLFEDIINEAKMNDGMIDKVFEQYDEDDVRQFLEVLENNKMLFRSVNEMEQADFLVEYLKIKKINPHKAYLHLTQRCNLKCKYCYNAKNLGKTEDMTTEQWMRILDRLKDKGFNFIVFTGGEVFLRKDILELTKYVKKLNMRLHILTNGTVKIEKDLIEVADIIEISLDAVDHEINAKGRINSDKFDILENILSIPTELRNKIVIKTVLSKNNRNSIIETREKIREEGFRENQIILQQPNSPDEADVYPEQVVPREPHAFDAGRITKCNACYEVIGINSDGKIYPCQALIKQNLFLANIFDDDWLKSIEESKITEVFYNDDVNQSECGLCKYRYICGGPCKAVSFNVTGSLLEGREGYCDYAKKECLEYLRSIDFGENE